MFSAVAGSRKRIRNKKNTVYGFLPTLQNMREQKKIKRVDAKTPNVLELSLSVLHGLETSSKTSGKCWVWW